ncbi:MAG: hypothetical protein JWN67_706 [Actinomycetia bacterium]|nr:hypothetical protein [Actinomycetes bacterium]
MGERLRRTSTPTADQQAPAAPTTAGRTVSNPAALLALQRSAGNAATLAHLQRKKDETGPNASGLPDKLKSSIESLSGISMGDVQVHYNSSEPAALQAGAYAQGSDIHVAPGQEQHLPHEAWHVVQQRGGRVPPDVQL